ncbi:hypothetical protein HWV62_12671 [Athelia sp. TMB]|nr:hypothetical protein HWV62_12671 [Athelia sp. TMB]
MSIQQRKIAMALQHAASDPMKREASWYCLWSYHLDIWLSQPREDAKMASVPLICPQFPVVAFFDVDTENQHTGGGDGGGGEEDKDKDEEEANNTDSDSADSLNLVAIEPPNKKVVSMRQPSRQKLVGQKSARDPSPDEIILTKENALNDYALQLPTAPTLSQTSQLGTSALSRSLPANQIRATSVAREAPEDLDVEQLDAFIRADSIRSTRIPDFARLLQSLPVKGDVLSRIDLLVEIKRAGMLMKIEWFAIEEQLDEQASHAFARWPDLQVVGAIAASGPVWNYREIRRGDIPTLNLEVDSDYRPSADPPSSPHPTDTPHSETYDKLMAYFTPEEKRLTLDTPESDAASGLLRDRLMELNPDLWP